MAAVVDGVTVSDRAVSAVRSTVATAGVITPPLVIGVTRPSPVAEAIVPATPAKARAVPLAIRVPDEPLLLVWTIISKSHIAAVVEATVVIAAVLQSKVPATPPQRKLNIRVGVEAVVVHWPMARIRKARPSCR